MSYKSQYADEKALISALITGDNNAFRQFVNDYQLSIRRICIGMLRSEADADDVAQEVFIEAFRSIAKFNEKAELSTWLYRIAVNKSLNYLRQKKSMKRDSVISISDEYKHSLQLSGSDSSEEAVTAGDHKKAIDSALIRLQDKQRTAFVLSKYEDLSYREIADLMKSSVGSVESLIFRAKKNLQRYLEKYYKENFS